MVTFILWLLAYFTVGIASVCLTSAVALWRGDLSSDLKSKESRKQYGGLCCLVFALWPFFLWVILMIGAEKCGSYLFLKLTDWLDGHIRNIGGRK